jgi:hypothetical protein
MICARESPQDHLKQVQGCVKYLETAFELQAKATGAVIPAWDGDC